MVKNTYVYKLTHTHIHSNISIYTYCWCIFMYISIKKALSFNRHPSPPGKMLICFILKVNCMKEIPVISVHIFFSPYELGCYTGVYLGKNTKCEITTPIHQNRNILIGYRWKISTWQSVSHFSRKYFAAWMPNLV